MRISDWSSDVCSSDLGARPDRPRGIGGRGRAALRCSLPFGRGFVPHHSGCATNFLRGAAATGDDPSGPSQQPGRTLRSEEHTSELQSLMRISYAVFCLKKTNDILSLINTLHHVTKSD